MGWREESARHGHSRKGAMTKTYMCWSNMRRRCEDESHVKFPRYGGRGISVCERWRLFDNFLADMGEKPEGLTLERIDLDGNYEPLNCKWASVDEQANNRSSNRLIEFDGKSMTAAMWAKETGISYGALRQRLHRGWPIQKALEQKQRGAEVRNV